MTKLKDLIEARGLKNKWVAQQIGVAEETFSRWVNGHVAVPDDKLQPLADLLHCSPEQIRNGKPKKRGRPRKHPEKEYRLPPRMPAEGFLGDSAVMARGEPQLLKKRRKKPAKKKSRK